MKNLLKISKENTSADLFVLRFYGQVNPMGSCRFVCVEVLAKSAQWGHVERGQFT